MIRLFQKDPMPLQVRKPVFTESAVTGKRTEPSKPFGDGDKRWFKTNLVQHFALVREEMGR